MRRQAGLQVVVGQSSAPVRSVVHKKVPQEPQELQELQVAVGMQALVVVPVVEHQRVMVA